MTAELLNKIMQGDCLVESEHIASGSVDLILTDLPYGNMKNAPSTWDADKTKWDTVIDPKDVYAVANRILRKNGKMVLFSQEPYTTQLITEAIPNVPFSYRAIWEKDTFANALLCNKAMVGYYEDILIFSKAHQKHDFEGKHPLRSYGKMCSEFINKSRKERKEALGHRGSDHFLESGNDPLQFSLCTEKTYNELIQLFKINEMDGFKEYAELKRLDVKFRVELLQRMNDEHPSVFNLWEGGKYKSNILRYKKDYDGYHPTQKPVLLLEDLIKTFSNEGDTVVDLTAGSGSTCVAAINTNRQFIGIEKESEYVEIGNRRIAEARAAIT